MMFFGSSTKRDQARDAFNVPEIEHGELLYPDTPDILLGIPQIMEEGVNLQRARFVIQCEPMYNACLMQQVLKRAHARVDEVNFYVITSQTEIEKAVDARRKAKLSFTKDAFQAKMHGPARAGNNVKTAIEIEDVAADGGVDEEEE